jgi:hypothetical protein
MIRPTIRYLRRQTCPRCWRLIFSFETLALVAAAVAMWFWGHLLPLDKIKIAGVTGAILSYASIAFGFCLTGMALSLTIPDRAFAIKMATTYVGDEKKGLSTYSDLIFIFSWAALAHLVAIALSLIPLFVVSTDASFQDLFASPASKGALCFYVGWLAYCVCRFAITILTLSQVGSVYLSLLVKDGGKK